MRVQRLAHECHEGLADGLVLRRVCVHVRGNILWLAAQSVNDLSLPDQLARITADDVNAEDHAALLANQLDETRRLEDLTLAVSAEAVHDALDLILAVNLDGLGFR